MYCPRCSAENREEQKYCRQCGLHLPGVRLALENRVGEAGELLKKGEDTLGSAAITLGIFLLIAIASFFMSSEKSWGVLINLLIGLLITAPMFISGLRRLDRSRKLLTPDRKQEDDSSAAINPPEPVVASLPEVPDTDPLEIRAPGSATEKTTLNLRHPEQHR